MMHDDLGSSLKGAHICPPGSNDDRGATHMLVRPGVAVPAEQFSPESSVLLGSYPFAARYAWVHDRFGVSWQLICREDGPA